MRKVLLITFLLLGLSGCRGIFNVQVLNSRAIQASPKAQETMQGGGSLSPLP